MCSFVVRRGLIVQSHQMGTCAECRDFCICDLSQSILQHLLSFAASLTYRRLQLFEIITPAAVTHAASTALASPVLDALVPVVDVVFVFLPVPRGTVSILMHGLTVHSRLRMFAPARFDEPLHAQMLEEFRSEG